MPRRERRCGTCEFYVATDEEPHCHRLPPLYNVEHPPALGLRQHYPVVDANLDWCGEWLNKNPEPPD